MSSEDLRDIDSISDFRLEFFVLSDLIAEMASYISLSLSNIPIIVIDIVLLSVFNQQLHYFAPHYACLRYYIVYVASPFHCLMIDDPRLQVY